MAQYISVKRKQQTNKRAPLAITLCLLLLFSSFSFIYANGIGELESLGISYTLNNNTIVSGNTFNIANGSGYPVKINFSQNGVYEISFDFACPTNSNYKLMAWNGGNTVDLFTYSDTGTLAANGRSVTIPQGSCSLTLHVESVVSDPVSALQFYVVKSDGSSASSYTGTISNFSISGEGSGIVDVGSKTLTCEPGYAVYILTNGGSIELTHTFSVYSNLFNGGWGKYNTQRIGISESRVPSSGYVFGANTGSVIPWTKLSTADSNALGQTKVGHFLYSNCPDDGRYVVVYNPVWAFDDDVTSNVNNTITIEVSNFCGANKFALRNTLGNNGVVEGSSPDDYENFKSTGGGDMIQGDGDSLVWYDASRDGSTSDMGTPQNFPDSPYNDTSSTPPNSSSIGSMLEQIIELLKAPIQHIQRLYNSAVGFFNYLVSLWGWLPPELVAIITSALAVLVVVGVVKFLWK